MLFPTKNRTLLPAEIVEVRDVTPHMRRVTIISEGLRGLPVDRPAQWMKVFFPAAHGQRPIGRAYTIRRFDSTAGCMELDFVLHGDNGPASRWAARAAVGEILEVAGPRAGHLIDPAAGSYLLIGDATALPAIAAILEALPAGIHAAAFIEVADAGDEQVLTCGASLHLTWLHSGAEAPGTTGQIELAVQHADVDTSNCQVWLAGESFMVRSVRTHLLVDRHIPQKRLMSAGYWKLGVADHRERD